MSKSNVVFAVGLLLCCSTGLAQPSALDTESGNTFVTQTIGELAAQGESVRPSSPKLSDIMPAHIAGGLSSQQPLGPNLRSFQDDDKPYLVGIYISSGKSVAEFNINGQVRYVETSDALKDGWIVRDIGRSGVSLEQCNAKKKCKTKNIAFEAH